MWKVYFSDFTGGIYGFYRQEWLGPSYFFIPLVLLRLYLTATWKSELGNDIHYIHRSVKPVKWPVADGGEEKVVFLREFF